MKAITVIIGDELLLGQVTDINSGMIARAIAPLGWELLRTVTVGDSSEAIRDAVERSLRDADLVITTGGLGPTKDDITKKVLAEITGGKMRFDEPSYENVKRIFAARGLELNDLTRAQALVPDSCTPIVNTCGTAPIMWFQIGKKCLVSMPGVPFEAKAAIAHDVVPRLRAMIPQAPEPVHRTVLLTGISESAVAQQIAAWEEQLPDGFHLAYLPDNGYLRLRLDGHGTDTAEVADTADRLQTQLCKLLGEHVWLTEDLTPAQALLNELISRHLTISTAESCTGGNITATLTAIPGSSEAVAGGVVAYCNEAKINILGVLPDTLSQFGAVSEPTVKQMAAGSQRLYGSDLAVATSGIAGPGGGTPQKPVGTVCVGLTFGGRCVEHTFHFPGNRSRVVQRTVNTVLIEALRLIKA